MLYTALQKAIKITLSSKDLEFVEANSCLLSRLESFCLRNAFLIFLYVYVLSSTVNGPCEPQRIPISV